MSRFVRGAAGAAVSLIVVGGWPEAASAQDPLDVRVEPSTRRLRVDDFLTLDVRAVARTQGDIRVDVPSIDGLEELTRSNYQSSSFSFSNGRQSITREQVITIEYVATRAGTFEIPSVTARVGRHQARSEPVQIVVDPRTERPSAPGEAPPPGQVRPPAADERDVFLRFRTSANEVYVGEQIILELVLFARPGANLSAEDLSPPPAPDGFWREVIEDNPRLRALGEQTIEGRRYRSYLRWRVALFPLDERDLELEPVAAVFRTGSAFGGGRRIRRTTRPLRVDVKPLPDRGRPEGFSPTHVGDYELTASVDQRSVDAGQGVLLTLTLSGRGNIRNVQPPEVGEVDGFRVFPPTRSEDVDLGAGEVRGKKAAEYLLTPERSGRLEIPSFETWSFDPEAGEYRRLTTDAIRIVARGRVPERAAPPPEPAPTPRPSAEVPRWRPVIPNPEIAPARPPWRTAWFFPALGAPWVLALGWVLVQRARRRDRPDFDLRGARRRVAEAAARGPAQAAWATFADALRDALAHRFEPAAKNWSPDEVEQRLRAEGLASDRVEAAKRALESGAFARFAPDLVPAVPEDAPEAWPALVEEVAR